MSELESILLKYHANDLPKHQAMALIQDLIDAERITYLDTVAVSALNGMLARPNSKPGHVDGYLSGSDAHYAKASYDYAKAMSVERAK